MFNPTSTLNCSNNLEYKKNASNNSDVVIERGPITKKISNTTGLETVLEATTMLNEIPLTGYTISTVQSTLDVLPSSDKKSPNEIDSANEDSFLSADNETIQRKSTRQKVKTLFYSSSR